jgi:hypothetical protein
VPNTFIAGVPAGENLNKAGMQRLRGCEHYFAEYVGFPDPRLRRQYPLSPSNRNNGYESPLPGFLLLEWHRGSKDHLGANS